MPTSFLADRFERHLPLGEDERAALWDVEGPVRTWRRGSVLRQEHGRADELHLVHAGWLSSSVVLSDGSRQILAFHLPGDLAGASAVAFVHATASLVALTEVRVATLQRSALTALFRAQPRLAAILFALAEAERVVAADRLASLGRTSAKARVAALLIDTFRRTRDAGSGGGDRFHLPLTQEEIGDATGLTAVHVNRMMRALVADGLISRTGSEIIVRNEAQLARVANHIDRWALIDLSWLGAPAAPR